MIEPEYEICECEQALALRDALEKIQSLLEKGCVVGTKSTADMALSRDDRSRSFYIQEILGEMQDVENKRG